VYLTCNALFPLPYRIFYSSEENKTAVYFNSNKITDNENSLLKVFDSQYLEITNKGKEYIEKTKKMSSNY